MRRDVSNLLVHPALRWLCIVALGCSAPKSHASNDATPGDVGGDSAAVIDAPVDGPTCPVKHHACSQGCCLDLDSIAVGGASSCVVTSDHALMCWGILNGHLSPYAVSGFASGVAAVALVDETTCVLGTAGNVKCWGRGTEGELGNGGMSNSATPVDVTGLSSGVVAIAAGDRFECALTSGGAVKCWGSSASGELGNGQATMRSLTPTDVSGLSSGVIAIAAGGSSMCALSTSGGVSCWGDFSLTASNAYVPIAVSNLTDATAITAMEMTMCAATSSGSEVCWGVNDTGELGNGTKMNSQPLTPVAVSGLTHVAHIAGGFQTACAVTMAGAASCWGAATSLGTQATGDTLTPVGVDGAGSGVTQIAGAPSASHACAVIAGTLECWGYNNAGQLGDGTSDSKVSPVVVQGLFEPAL